MKRCKRHADKRMVQNVVRIVWDSPDDGYATFVSKLVQWRPR
jgi:hypothetical protein